MRETARSRLLDRNKMRALLSEAAVKAVAEFNVAAGDPQTWEKNTKSFLLVAAAESDDAKAQALNHYPAEGLSGKWKGNGGWRALVAQGTDIHKPEVIELVSELVSATLELAKQGTADPREAALVAQLYLPTDGDSRQRERALEEKKRACSESERAGGICGRERRRVRTCDEDRQRNEGESNGDNRIITRDMQRRPHLASRDNA